MKAFTIVSMILLALYMSITLNMVAEELDRSDTVQHRQQTQTQVFKEELQLEELNARIETYKKEIECLAKNMYFEARGEEVLGQDAVAFVTINRVRSDRYPDTICEVVYQAKTDSRGHPLRNQCQFSWYCDGKVDSVTESVYNELRARAEYVYINYYLSDGMADITDGATHYHSKQVKPYWSEHKNYQLVASIGQHVFYQPTY